MQGKQVRTGQATTGHVTQSTNSQSKQTQRVKASQGPTTHIQDRICKTEGLPARKFSQPGNQVSVNGATTGHVTQQNPTTSSYFPSKPGPTILQDVICRFSGTARRTTLDAVENIRRLPVHMPSSCAGSRNRGSKVRAPKGKYPPRMQQRSTNLQSRHHTVSLRRSVSETAQRRSTRRCREDSPRRGRPVSVENPHAGFPALFNSQLRFLQLQ
jgi:hypothetical protein